jgi:biotin carboxyl carrier protein
MRYLIRIGDVTHDIEVEELAGRLHVRLDGKPVHADLQQAGHEHAYSLLLDGRSWQVFASGAVPLLRLYVDGHQVDAEVLTGAAAQALRSARTDPTTGVTGPLVIKAPMPGVVKEVRVKPKDQVEKGQSLLVLEAMKMANDVRAPRSATVHHVPVVPGQRIAKGDVLIELA